LGYELQTALRLPQLLQIPITILLLQELQVQRKAQEPPEKVTKPDHLTLAFSTASKLN
jgi:hypothetical protein